MNWSSWTCFPSDQLPECTCCGGAFVGPLVIRECIPCVSFSPLSSSAPLSPQAPSRYQHLQGKGGGGYNTCKITLVSPWHRLHRVGLLWVRYTHIRRVIAGISTFQEVEEEGKAEERRSGTAATNSCQPPVKKINVCVTLLQLLKSLVA